MGVRRYSPRDRPALREVCVRTARAGHDARGLFGDDGLWADVFLEPYLHFEPELAFVAATGAGAAGYIVATADTPGFVGRYRAEWMPRLATRYHAPSPEQVDESAESLEGAITRLAFRPERMLRAGTARHPAHLHIDLVPEIQGKGLGRELMRMLLGELAGRGIPGVHLGIDPANTAAREFYEHLGFVELSGSTPQDPLYGIETSAVL